MLDERAGTASRRVPRTKIMVPDLPVQLVSRPRLLRVLDKAAVAPVTLLSAPAGTGKTVMLGEWASRHGASEVSWVSLDSYDNDDRRFWSAVLDALAANPGVPDLSPIRTLAVPTDPGGDLSFLATVVDALDALPHPVTLVLDDVQDLVDARRAHGLRVLIRNRPAGLRLVLAGRGEPPVSLARLRLAGQLAEIDAEALRFTVAEARSLVAIGGAAITPDETVRLVDATEGWPVGLRMAVAAALRDGDVDEFLAGHDRALRDYLTDEVFAAMRADQRELLHATCGCREVTPALAAILSGRSDAEGLLDELADQAILTTRPVGPELGYRMPTLLRSYVVAELSSRDPARVDRLHGTAARWFAQRGRAADALWHAAQARDDASVAALLRAHAVDLFAAGRDDVLRAALGALDDPVIAADPLLALMSASLYLEAGEADAADLRLAQAAASWPARVTPELQVLRQLAVARRAQLAGDGKGIVVALRAVNLGLARATALGGLADVNHETLALITDDPSGSQRRLMALLDEATGAGQEHVVARCLTSLAELAAVDGDLDAMQRFARTVDARLPGSAAQGELDRATVRLLLAYGALLRAEPMECVRQSVRLGNAPRHALAGRHNLHLVAAVLRAAAEFELGDWHAGLRRMRAARTAIGANTLPPHLAALCAVLEHRAALLLGSVAQAREVVQWGQAALRSPGEPLLMRGRMQFTLGRHISAWKVLDPVLSGDARCALPWTVLEAALLGVRIAAHDGADDVARPLLDRSLAMGEAMGAWYPFVFAPVDLVEVITRHLGRLGPHEKFASQVLAHRRRLAPPVSPPPLTEREMSVLRLLPTLRSIDEIAEDLTVSPNTVKTHVRGIYAKLNVRRRRDAVAIAISHGLLDKESPIAWTKASTAGPNDPGNPISPAITSVACPR